METVTSAAPARRRYGVTRGDEFRITNAKRRLLQRANATSCLPETRSGRSTRRRVVLDMDNILLSMRTSKLLHEAVDGAAAGDDLRINIAELTALLTGSGAADAYCALDAVYAQTPPAIAAVFEDVGWTLHRVHFQGASRQDTIRRLLLADGRAGQTETIPTTLVLATGDGDLVDASCRGTSSKASTRPSLYDLLDATPCHVEIFSWLHALHNGFFDLQRRFPARVCVHALDDNCCNAHYDIPRRGTGILTVYVLL